MRWSDATKPPTDRQLREFAAVCSVVCGGLAIWYFLAGSHLYLGAVFALLALLPVCLMIICPRWLAAIFSLWMIAAWPVAWLGSLVVLATIFFGVVMPLGFLLRALGRDPLDNGPASQQDSYWKVKPAAEGPERYLRQY